MKMAANRTENGMARGDHDARTPRTHESHQNQKNQENSLPERGCDRRDGSLHERFLLVVGDDVDALGKRLVDGSESGLDTANDGRGIGAIQLDDHTRDDFFNAAACLQAAPDGAANLDGGHIFHENRRAVGRSDH